MRILCVFAAMAFMTGCGGRDTAAPASADPSAIQGLEAEWQAEYDAMAADLPLSPAESDALRAAFKSVQDDLRGWMNGPDGKRLIELEADMAAAAKRRDLGGVQAATSAARPLRDAFEAKIAAGKRGLLNALTPENRSRWGGHRLASHLLELMAPLGLSPEQQAAIRDNAAKALDQAAASGEPNPQAAAFLEFEKWLEASVLTPEQRTAYEAVKRAKPMRSLTY